MGGRDGGRASLAGWPAGWRAAAARAGRWGVRSGRAGAVLPAPPAQQPLSMHTHSLPPVRFPAPTALAAPSRSGPLAWPAAWSLWRSSRRPRATCRKRASTRCPAPSCVRQHQRCRAGPPPPACNPQRLPCLARCMFAGAGGESLLSLRPCQRPSALGSPAQATKHTCHPPACLPLPLPCPPRSRPSGHQLSPVSEGVLCRASAAAF